MPEELLCLPGKNFVCVWAATTRWPDWVSGSAFGLDHDGSISAIMTVVALISVLLLVSVLAFETRVCSRAISLIQDATGGRTLREPTVQAFHAVAEKTRQSLRCLRPLARSHDAQFSRTELLLRGKLQKKRVTNHSHALLARGLCDAAEFDHDENLSIVEQYLHRPDQRPWRSTNRCKYCSTMDKFSS